MYLENGSVSLFKFDGWNDARYKYPQWMLCTVSRFTGCRTAVRHTGDKRVVLCESEVHLGPRNQKMGIGTYVSFLGKNSERCVNVKSMSPLYKPPRDSSRTRANQSEQ